MGASCSADVKNPSDTVFPLIDTEASSQSFDNSDEGESMIHRHLSTPSSVLKSLFSFKGTPNTTSVGEETDDWDKEGNETLEQLWEDCFDLSEIIVRTCLRFKEYQEELMDREGNKSEEEQSCVKLTTIFVNRLEKNGFHEVVSGMSAIFSTEELKYDNLASDY